MMMIMLMLSDLEVHIERCSSCTDNSNRDCEIIKI